jgi:hypothetical protein
LLELLLITCGNSGSTDSGVLVETFLGLVISVLDNDLAGLQEKVEGHGAVLLVLRLSEELTLFLDQSDHLGGRLGTIELSLLLRFLLGDHYPAETLKFVVVLKIVVFAGLGQMGQVEAELDLERVRGLAHLDGLDLRLSLGAGGELERLKLAEHFHVALELEFGCLDNIILGLVDDLGLKGHAHLRVLLLDSLALLLVFHVLADGELVVLGFELDPLASFLGDGDDSFLVFDLTLTENGDILLLVLLLVSLEFLCVKLSSLWSE